MNKKTGIIFTYNHDDFLKAVASLEQYVKDGNENLKIGELPFMKMDIHDHALKDLFIKAQKEVLKSLKEYL